MKKLVLLAVLAISLLTELSAQSRTVLYGASPFQDSLWVFDTTNNMSVIRRWGPTPSSGGSITGINAIAEHPVTGQLFVVIKQSAVTGRVLGIFNPITGVVQIIGNLGDNFSSITFNGNNTLVGVTGDGATVPETVYRIDQTNASKTLLRTLGNGADGEIICYNPFDNMYYHWSGNGTIVYEKFDTAGVTVTNIPITGTTNGETFGAVYGGNNNFITSNISSRFQRWSASGTVFAQFGNTTPDDVRGLAIVTCARTISGNPNYCAGDSTALTHDSPGGVYQWYMNGTVIPGANSQTYYASQEGWYNCIVFDACGQDSMSTGVAVNENPLPSVSLSGNAGYCTGDSTQLTGSSGGTSQWYLNGVAIPGATSSTYFASAPGVYNMTKTNLNGCSDSAATGITVTSLQSPVVSLGNDTAVCAWVVLDAGNPGATYAWSSGSTSQLDTVMASGPNSVVVTDPNGCTAHDTITITVNPDPVVDLGSDTTVCGSITLDAGNPGSSYLWCNGATTQTNLFNISGTCAVFVQDVNGCVGSDTITLTVNQNPVVNLGPDVQACTMATLSDPSLSGGSYLWCDGSTTATIIVTSSGTCALMYTDSLGCTGTDTINVTITGNPVVTAAASSTAVCADDADVALTGTPAGGSFTGTSVTGTAFDPSAGPGSYAVVYTVTDANGCTGTDTLNIMVSACVGIAENAENAFSVYPNPSTGIFTLNLPASGSTVEVYDVLGNVISSVKYTNAGTVQLDLSAQAEGVYFIRVNGQNTQRLVIRK